MRITENQIRRIIRQVLTEAKRATNWDEYVEYTITNNPDLDLTLEDMKAFVEEYKSVLSNYLNEERLNVKLGLQAAVEFKPNQTDSYDDFVKWYMRFNNSINGKLRRDKNNSGKWLHTLDVLDTIAWIRMALDKDQFNAFWGDTGLSPDTDQEPTEEEKQKFSEKVGSLIANFKSNRTAKKDTRQQGREERKEIRMGIDEEGSLAWVDATWQADGFPGWELSDFKKFRRKLQRQFVKGSRYKQKQLIQGIRGGTLTDEKNDDTITFLPSEVAEVEDV